MQRAWFSVFLLLGGLLLAVAQATPPASAEKEVLAAEEARVRAVVAADTAALEGLLADELSYTHSTGWVETKTQFLTSIRTGSLKYEEMKHSETSVRVYGLAAVLTGRSAVRVRSPRSPGAVTEMNIRFTTVYVRRDGRWLQAAWHSTRIP